MHSVESTLSIVEPRTAGLAVELLRICTTILSHDDPKGTLADGPVLEIVRNVMRSLERLPAGMEMATPDGSGA